MKIIISPAKKMVVNTDTVRWETKPCFEEKGEYLKNWLQSMSYEQLKALWNCSEKLATKNMERIRAMDLSRNRTAALLSYEGIQYQYMAPEVFSDRAWEYVQEHLRILSGFYGVVRPKDGIVPYRLEMQTKPGPKGCETLYEYWGRSIYEEIARDTDLIVNLASKEYSVCVEKYVEKDVEFLNCIFAEKAGGKLRQKATPAKMARGEMVRYLAENGITEKEQIKRFNGLGFWFSKEDSDESTYTFIRQKIED